jgi:predicted metalloprotease
VTVQKRGDTSAFEGVTTPFPEHKTTISEDFRVIYFASMGSKTYISIHWTDAPRLPWKPGMKILAVIPDGDERELALIEQRYSRLRNSKHSFRVAPELTAFIDALGMAVDPSSVPQEPRSTDLVDRLTELAIDARAGHLADSMLIRLAVDRIRELEGRLTRLVKAGERSIEEMEDTIRCRDKPEDAPARSVIEQLRKAVEDNRDLEQIQRVRQSADDDD